MMAARRQKRKKRFQLRHGLLAIVMLMLTLASSKETLAFMKSQTGAVTNTFDFYYYYALKYDMNGGNENTKPDTQYGQSKNNSFDFTIQHKQGVEPAKEGCFFLGWAEEQYNAEITNGWAKYNNTTVNGQSTSFTVSAEAHYRDTAVKGYGFSRTLYAQWGSQLIPGPELNIKIKQIAKNSTSGNTLTTTGDRRVQKIVFKQVDKDIDAYAQEKGMRGLEGSGVVVDEEGTGSIKLYYNDTEKTAYILSQHHIFANTNSSYTFSCFNKLNSIEFKNFNTEKVTNMSSMFNCQNNTLSNLDLSCFNTTNVTDMSYMFSNCSGLTNISWVPDKFSTAEVTNMSYMFYNCGALLSIDFSKYNTEKVTNMSHMFANCSAIESLDLSTWRTLEVTSMSNMFNSCFELITIYVDDGWDVSNVNDSGDMFYNCALLIGERGTEVDGSHLDKEYARIDNPPGSPGYLTHISQKPSGAMLFSLVETPSNGVTAEENSTVIGEVHGTAEVQEPGDVQDSGAVEGETVENDIQNIVPSEGASTSVENGMDTQKGVAE